MKNHKLKVLETKVLRKIYGPKREVEEWDGGTCAMRGWEERHIEGFGEESWTKETISKG